MLNIFWTLTCGRSIERGRLMEGRLMGVRLYFLCKTNFGPLVNFIDFLGLKLSKICIGKNAKYRSDKSIQEMLYAMSDLIEDRILDDLKKSHFFALMFDETTDCSVIEQLVIRTRYIDSDSVLKVKFLKMLDAQPNHKS